MGYIIYAVDLGPGQLFMPGPDPGGGVMGVATPPPPTSPKNKIFTLFI